MAVTKAATNSRVHAGKAEAAESEAYTPPAFAVQVFRVKIAGLRPLMVHNARELADPTSQVARKIKEISLIRNKTDEHYKQMADLEWVGGMYLNDDRRPIIPDVVLEGALTSAAKKLRLGPSLKAGVQVIDSPLIEHDGPAGATVDDLFGNPRFRDLRGVKVGTARVMRCRPIFPKWALSFRVQVDPEAIKPNELRSIFEVGGRMVGLCEYRPQFGKYELVQFAQEV